MELPRTFDNDYDEEGWIIDRRRLLLSVIGALAMAGVIATTTSYAQTSGMEPRGERRENRDGAQDT